MVVYLLIEKREKRARSIFSGLLKGGKEKNEEVVLPPPREKGERRNVDLHRVGPAKGGVLFWRKKRNAPFPGGANW